MDRNEAYTALSDLVFRGFLTTELDIEDQFFIFKSLNEKEIDLIKMYSGKPTRPDYLGRFNIYFLVFSLLMINGRNVLTERESLIPDLFNTFEKMPHQFVKLIMAKLHELRKISFDCLRYLEGFSYTSVARNNWKTIKGRSPSSIEFTGVPGTERIGLNIHQESWVMINHALDSEEMYNHQFSLAVMVASASNAKGAKNIRNQHDSTKKNIEDRRNRLRKEGNLEDTIRRWKPDGWAASVDTTEELLAELNRQMAGIKDKHDIFIEEYMQELKDEANQKVQEAEDRIKKSMEDYDNVLIDGSQKVLSIEEMSELNSQKASTLIRVPDEEYMNKSDKEKFLKKIGTKVLTG